MSASVRIESGIAAGTNYWIDRPVLRIGSDPQCEICLPSADLSPHALTLEFRGGVYRAYNRGSEPFSVGSTFLQPGGVANWDEGTTVTLPGDLRLVLAFDGDPRPCPRPDSLADDDDFEDQPAITNATAAVSQEEAKKKKSKSMVQLAVILVCMAMTGGFLFLMNSTGGAPASNRPSFNQIVVASLKKGDSVRALTQKLQYAQSFLVRGDFDRAKFLFSNLRDQLIRQKEAVPKAELPEIQLLLDYVETQLGQLG